MSTVAQAKVLILGAGAAGYTAALYASRAGLDPILLRGPAPGGQLTVTTDVENFPGFSDVIQGPWLMEQMALQAAKAGARLLDVTAVGCDLLAPPWRCWDDRGSIYSGDTLIIATGAQARWLGLPSESTYRGFGVSGCAVCDGVFFRDRDVVVVGGGNSAVEEALHLLPHVRHLTLVHRRDRLRAEKILQDRLSSHPAVSMIWNSVVEDILGEANPRKVSEVRLRNLKTGAKEDLHCQGVFVAIGHDPATSLFKGQLSLDANGYIITRPNSTATEIDGVFAAGDVKDRVFRQAVTAAGMGCMAALEAEKFLASRHGEAL